MEKPRDFDGVQAYGEYRPLKPGGYVCRIMNVMETLSSTKKNMLVIDLDIAEGPEKDRFRNEYLSDTRSPKKWGCKANQLVYDNDGNTNKGFKTFITSAQNSNPGFNVAWGGGFCESLKGKLIGGVFGREQYINSKGESKFITKCQQFRSVETVRAGIEPPEDKLLNPADKKPADDKYSGFYALEPLPDDSGLPF